MNSDSFSDSGAEFPEVQVLVDGDGSPIPDSEAPRQSLSRPSTVRSDQARSNRVGWSPFPPINSMVCERESSLQAKLSGFPSC